MRDDGDGRGEGVRVSIGHSGRRVSLNTLCISYGYIHGEVQRLFLLKKCFVLICFYNSEPVTGFLSK